MNKEETATPATFSPATPVELPPELDRMFPRHPLPRAADETVAQAAELRDHFRHLAAEVAKLPASRHVAIALTKLEEASMVAVRAVFVHNFGAPSPELSPDQDAGADAD